MSSNSNEKLKYKIVNYLENKCSNCKISKKTYGTFIRGFHICSPFNICLAMLYVPKLMCIIFIIILLFLLLFFYMFDGCILTMLERKLCGDNFTFIDPILEYNNLELNSKNRYNVSIKVALGYLSIMILIFIFRFLI